MPRRRKTPLKRILLITFILIVIFIISLFYFHRQSNAPQRLEKTNNIARRDSIKPHFTFFKIISKNDPQQTIAIKNSLPQPNLPLAQPANYLLQIAAVKNSAYADQLKAQLVLKGYNVSIQPIQSNGDELNRVLIGPFATQAKAQEIQTSLKNNDKLDSVLLKM